MSHCRTRAPGLKFAGQLRLAGGPRSPSGNRTKSIHLKIEWIEITYKTKRACRTSPAKWEASGTTDQPMWRQSASSLFAIPWRAPRERCLYNFVFPSLLSLFARSTEETLRIPRCQRIFSSKFFGRIIFTAVLDRDHPRNNTSKRKVERILYTGGKRRKTWTRVKTFVESTSELHEAFGQARKREIGTLKWSTNQCWKWRRLIMIFKNWIRQL